VAEMAEAFPVGRREGVESGVNAAEARPNTGARPEGPPGCRTSEFGGRRVGRPTAAAGWFSLS
jgi:hypothetical protein